MIFKNQSGFTLIELLVAVTIMAVGFLAVSQMQFLSFRQKTLANEGVLATNVIQFAADRDLAEMKRRHLHNSYGYLDGLNSGSPIDSNTFEFCGSGNLCDPCPCDPFEVVIADATADGSNETACSAVNPEEFDPEALQYVTVDNCAAGCTADECLYLVRTAETNFIDNAFNSDNIVVTITYGVKNLRQINDTDNNSNVSLRHTLATQDFQISGHVATNWDQYVSPQANWDEVNIPHVP